METDPREAIFQSVAKDLATQVVRLFNEPPLDPTPVNLDTYLHLDRAWYRTAAAELEAQGFRLVRDLDGARAVAPGAPVPLVRVFLSADGKTSAALYHVKPLIPPANFLVKAILWLTGKWPKGAKVVECMSYAGERVISTSNQGSANSFQPPPGATRTTLPLGTSVGAVVAAHAATVRESALSFDAMPDFDAMQVRRNAMLERTRAWRADVGLLPVELEALTAPHGEFGVQLRPYIERELAARRG